MRDIKAIERVTWKEKRVISGKEVIVSHIDVLGYDGVWEEGGYKVEVSEREVMRLVGYPRDRDIKVRMGEIFG